MRKKKFKKEFKMIIFNKLEKFKNNSQKETLCNFFKKQKIVWLKRFLREGQSLKSKQKK